MPPLFLAPCHVPGAFETNPEAYGVLERLQEVSGLDRYWRTFTDTVLALGEDRPDAFSPGTIVIAAWNKLMLGPCPIPRRR